MPICKIVFRIDFKPNFEILDSPGKIMKVLWDSFDKFHKDKSSINENIQSRLVTCRYTGNSSEVAKHINVQPNTINGLLEIVEGIEFDDLINDEKNFLLLLKSSDKLIKEFAIDDVRRLGLRIYFFEKIHDDVDVVLKAHRKLYLGNLINSISDSIGNINDYAVSLDGKSDDNLNYHMRFGPFRPEESERYFQHVVNTFKKESLHNFICDIDLYEEKFALANRSLSAIFKTYLSKSKKSIEDIMEHLKTNIEEE